MAEWNPFNSGVEQTSSSSCSALTSRICLITLRCRWRNSNRHRNVGNKFSLSLTVVAFTFRSETPTAVFYREKECQQTKQSNTMATPSRSHPRIGHRHSICESIKWEKCNLRHLRVILDISSGLPLLAI
jgi:hypothetical protein